MARGRSSRSAGKSSSSRSRRARPSAAGGNDYAPSSSGSGNTNDEATRPMEERLRSIEYHWGSFSPHARRFLLDSPGTLTLRKLVDFFVSRPDEAAYAQMPVSSGTAHLLAYEYFNIAAYENAKALTLCGSFFQQCQSAETSPEKIATMAIEDEKNPVELPLYYRGVLATKDQISMSCFLKKVLPLKYQKMMAFESHSHNAPGMQYVDLISNDWNGGTSNNPSAKRPKEKCNSEEVTIVLSNKDNGTKYEKSIQTGTTLKSLFNGYADECGVSLRGLRFSYNGSTIFLSSVGRKTPEDLGMKHMDTIDVFSIMAKVQPNKERTTSLPSPKARPDPKKMAVKKPLAAARGKQEKKQSQPQAMISIPGSDAERDKLAHSKSLSKVFEEMQPALRATRRRLNDLVLVRQASKDKKRPSSARNNPADDNAPGVTFNPSAAGIGGKAGKTSYIVNVGRVENLYLTRKIPKRGAAGRHRNQGARSLYSRGAAATVDLHGCTREEALERLGSCLKEWTNAAMRGNYPWVIPATIVCGAGNQILSETVDAWIRETTNVANAPKGSI